MSCLTKTKRTLQLLPPPLLFGLPWLVAVALFSDTIVEALLGVSATIWITMLIFAPKPIEERLTEANREDKEPKEWLRQATLFWLFSCLLFLIQLLIQGQGDLLLDSETYDFPFYLGGVFFALGVFRTYHVGEFLRDSSYSPRFGFVRGALFAWALFEALLSLVLLAILLPYFFVATLAAKGLMLTFVAIVPAYAMTGYYVWKGNAVFSRRTLGLIAFAGLPIFYVLFLALLPYLPRL